MPTPYGEVSVKLGCLNGQVLHAAPEFEACRKVSIEAQVPIKEVYCGRRDGRTGSFSYLNFRVGISDFEFLFRPPARTPARIVLAPPCAILSDRGR